MGKSQKQPKKYSCKLCDKSYIQPRCLRHHTKNVHEGIFFKCDSCEKSFTKSYNLNAHRKSIHDKIRINCDSCTKTFAQSQNLLVHKRSIHEKIRFECDGCDKTYVQPNQLKIHKRKAHGPSEENWNKIGENKAYQSDDLEYDKNESVHDDQMREVYQEKTKQYETYQDNNNS